MTDDPKATLDAALATAKMREIRRVARDGMVGALKLGLTMGLFSIEDIALGDDGSFRVTIATDDEGATMFDGLPPEPASPKFREIAAARARLQKATFLMAATCDDEALREKRAKELDAALDGVAVLTGLWR